METRSAKRKKLLKNAAENDGERGEDRISDLPDVVLHHILFLLPIKSIAQTSTLSNRWRILWYSFPDLDFTTINPIANSSTNIINSTSRKRLHSWPIAKGTDFKHEIIGQVLAVRDRHSDIRTLRLRARLSFSRLNFLIRRAVRQNVQELDIEVTTVDYFNFPRSVLTSDSLRIFRLKSCSPGFRLPPPTIMKAGFHSLHTLSLSLIILYKEASLLDLFTDSSFPFLKNLNMDSCFGLKHFGVSCRALEDLSLENCFQLDDLEICSPKLERLRVTSCFDAYSRNSWVKIDAPKLQIMVWSYNAITDSIFLENLTSLHEASIGFFVIKEDLSAGKIWSISNFLSGLSHAQCLTLESQCVEILSKNNQIAGVLLQPFANLRSLELHTSFTKHNIPGLASLISSSLNLHTLIINIINHKPGRRQWNSDSWDSAGSEEERFWESQSQALKSFLHHLKVVKIHGFSECEDDVNLVKFLLRHGRVLQEMILFSGHCNSRGSLRREKVKSQMMRFSMASSSTKIVFL